MKVLFIGDPNTGHTERFIKNLVESTTDIEVDILCDCHSSDISNLLPYCNQIFNNTYCFPSLLYRIPKINSRLVRKDFLTEISKIPDKYYDIVNVHFVGINTYYANNELHRIAKKVLLTPYGSDVLRATPNGLKLLQHVYDTADGVTLSPVREHGFYVKVKEIFSIPESKIYEAGFGSDAIDRLLQDKQSRNEAKKNLELNGRYVITIGYNGSAGQQHSKVIDAINSVKKDLPSNLTVLIPATYPSNNDAYLQTLKSKLEEYSIEYKIINRFLTLEELVQLRKCTDMFIHAQITDASCASIMEYMLTDAIIVNGSWLSYPELERKGMPYVRFSDFDELRIKIVEASLQNSLVSSELKEYLSARGWKEEIKYWTRCYNNLLNER